MMRDWETIQPAFAEIRRQYGLDALVPLLGCSRASVARWASGERTPNSRSHQDNIRALVARAESHRLSQLRPPIDP